MALFFAALVLCSNNKLQAAIDSGDVYANIYVNSRPIKEVARLISEQTGYKVELKAIDEAFLVTGQYHKVAVEKIFTHLLKRYNISVAINPTNKIISVESLGGKIKLANNAQNFEPSSPALVSTTEAEPLPPVIEVKDDANNSDPSLELAGVSRDDLEMLHAQQTKDFMQQQSDSKTIDPFTGLTIAALQDMQKNRIWNRNKDVTQCCSDSKERKSTQLRRRIYHDYNNLESIVAHILFCLLFGIIDL